jgi:hypothetical protein
MFMIKKDGGAICDRYFSLCLMRIEFGMGQVFPDYGNLNGPNF